MGEPGAAPEIQWAKDAGARFCTQSNADLRATALDVLDTDMSLSALETVRC
jgi:hypothetical protein